MRVRTRLVLADALAPDGVSILSADETLQVEDYSGRSRAELKEALAGASGLIVRSGTQADAELIAAGESLRVIGRAGVGLDNIDVDAATRQGVAVLNAPAGNTVSTAELAFALLLSAARRIPAADRSVRDGEWDRKAFHGSQLAGKSLGVIGAGRIGAEVILRARAFGMRVMVADPYMTTDRAADLSVELLELEDMLPRADYVTLHVPLTRETAGLMDARRIGMLKSSAILVNAARGGIVDEGALAEALQEGRLAGAAVDVFDREPLAADHPLRDAPNLVMTPHLGAATHDAQRKVAIEIAEAVRAALVDGDYSAAINMPPSLPRDRDHLVPVLDLAERLGSIVAVVTDGGVNELSVRYGGEVARGLRLIRSAARPDRSDAEPDQRPAPGSRERHHRVSHPGRRGLGLPWIGGGVRRGGWGAPHGQRRCRAGRRAPPPPGGSLPRRRGTTRQPAHRSQRRLSGCDRRSRHAVGNGRSQHRRVPPRS
jgi:D-3-phosphoglycerate dehydrogenase